LQAFATSLLGLLLALPATPAIGKTLAGGKNEKLHAGIEIGSKGVKATASNFTRKGSGYDLKILYAETINTTIMKVKENQFTPEAINETVQAVQKMYTKMQQEHQIAPERIYIVGSSGLRADNKQELVSEVKKATGKAMSFLSVELEVQLSIVGTIPQQRPQPDAENRAVNERHAAMLIDIGSGNTKGGYQQAAPAPLNGVPSDEFVTMGIPFGTVTFTTEASRYRKDEADLRAFALDAVALSPKLLNEQLKQEVTKKPGLVMRERLYMTGGIVWAMATLLHPENRRAFVPLTVEDINLFNYQARTDVNSLLNPDLSFINDEVRRQEAKKEIESVKAVFTPRNIIAGAEILSAVSTEFKLQDMKVWFARYGSLSWILSYVRGQAEKQLLAAERSTTSVQK
nr:hypothetical protein [Acidobacteriota bacterium]